MTNLQEAAIQQARSWLLEQAELAGLSMHQNGLETTLEELKIAQFVVVGPHEMSVDDPESFNASFYVEIDKLDAPDFLDQLKLRWTTAMYSIWHLVCKDRYDAQYVRHDTKEMCLPSDFKKSADNENV